MQNLSGVSQITWKNLSEVLEYTSKMAQRDDERVYALRATNWLHERGVS
jgi:hypothetical protein